jgi:Zn-dependent peptidase ImmA (M78 family)
MLSIQSIEKKLQDFLIDIDEKNFPIDLNRIVEKIGFEVNYYNFIKISGGIKYNQNGKGEIKIKSSDSIERRRFTVAHEIGHYVLHYKDAEDKDSIEQEIDLIEGHDVNETRDDVVLCDKKRQKEQEADMFAGMLLMPREKFIKMWKSHKALNLGVDFLAEYFGVSKKAVDVRASILKLS